MTTNPAATHEYGLLVLQQGKPQQVLAKFLNLMLNYQYGLSIVVAPDLTKAAELLAQHGERIRCVCVIQDTEISSAVALQALGMQGKIRLFLILPTKKLGMQRMAASGLEAISYCAWEQAFTHGNASLQSTVGTTLEEGGIGNLITDVESLPYDQIRQQVERRLRNINTLPTMPEIVMRIMRMVNDPKTTPDELERVLCTDPAIVMKLLQVMRSPVFTGTAGRTSKWTLKEIITRLGVKKVGAIAQQVKMINGLVKPEDSDFELQRFWEHSVATAIIADKLCVEKKLRLAGGELEFTDYWIGSLLHDIGKLVLGFFFWDWTTRLLGHSRNKSVSFRQAEIDMGDVAGHQRLGQLLLINADMGAEAVGVVGHHHDLHETTDLECLVHLADNLAKAVGLGFLPGDEPEFDEKAMAQVGVSAAALEQIKEDLEESTVEEIRTVVAQCM
ncbi:MAG: HDOD domain-containing protein [Gemmatimonadetes bacterium]|nr:HDOD domain-containing protein [Gemmatimonadota bacterium]MBT5059349.1 HDOD domain-containing protein [Gemmatimonadota bacterium]MBT5141511.1 HDOD domain-containing protein [Gemmatimonadota bacterium]MBT5588807.1 HDOD domain-containing protein [Gemmatimonadota bacterium]MBT5965121.1 HDOD domain-containing protein [Gemmatimonadota bacterium]